MNYFRLPLLLLMFYFFHFTSVIAGKDLTVSGIYTGEDAAEITPGAQILKYDPA